jgi:hypothetical protein
VQVLEEFMAFGLVHGCVHDTGRNGVHADSLGCVLRPQAVGPVSL